MKIDVTTHLPPRRRNNLPPAHPSLHFTSGHVHLTVLSLWRLLRRALAAHSSTRDRESQNRRGCFCACARHGECCGTQAQCALHTAKLGMPRCSNADAGPRVLDVQRRRSSFARARPGDGWRPHARAQGHMTQHGLASARETVLVVLGPH